MGRGTAKALFVFVFMAFLAAEAASGFMRELFAGRVYPRAMRAIDWILETFVTSPLGQTAGAIVLLASGAMFAALIWRQAAREHA